ncbi:precorrin-3B synthase [Gordonia humi]|uniref:precorrin-3B synthase n=1 Tax=Gordonia humi TaxID=686429 RepID=UPI003605ECC0
MSSAPSSPVPDRCPGVFRTHTAADGELARIRVPGGVIDAAALEALALAADEYGDGAIEITVRGNLQVRGISDVAGFGAAVTAAGLAGDADHDRVRNIATSPLTGRIGGLADLRPVADELGAHLTAQSWSSGLSGRFWFGLDDGRGDVLAHRTDVTGVAVDADSAVVVVDGRAVGGPMPLADLPATMAHAASTFHDLADGAWRIGDLPAARLAELHERLETVDRRIPDAVHPDPRVGWFEQSDGRVVLGAVVPFGRLTAEQARYAAAVGRPVTVTAEREILIGDLDEAVAETVVRVLAPLGFVFDARSPWVSLTACTGSPGCVRSLADVRHDLRRHVAARHLDDDTPSAEHWVGCARGCGSPPARTCASRRPATDIGAAHADRTLGRPPVRDGLSARFRDEPLPRFRDEPSPQ